MIPQYKFETDGRMRLYEMQIEEMGEKKKISPFVRLRSYLRGNLPTMQDQLARLVEINSFYRVCY